jgi:hypothetical protein
MVFVVHLLGEEGGIPVTHPYYTPLKANVFFMMFA